VVSISKYRTTPPLSNMNTVLLETKSNADLKSITALARKMNMTVLPLTRQEREEIEDMQLLHLMLDAKEEGAANTEDTLFKLGIIKR
jgi:predicted RecB family endonuclease